uniref:transposase n=1 Tax=Mastigocladopsis repens TaxID=221287 RepID=UPI0002FFE8D4
MGWHFGFKLHLIINDQGQLLAFKLTPANVVREACPKDFDREPVPDMTKDLIGKLFGDRGYISQKLFEQQFVPNRMLSAP